jgi:hypothetical protein
MNAAISQAIETERERVAHMGRLELPTRCLAVNKAAVIETALVVV